MSLAHSRKRHIVIPGRQRAARLSAQAALEMRTPERWEAAVAAFMEKKMAGPNPVGLKRWYVPGTEFEGEGVRTMYANKARARRRTAGKIARRSRMHNHLRPGGKRRNRG